LCVAGDDDQSIYTSLRYAHPEGIISFVNEEGTSKKVLTHCRRCPEPVVAIANNLMHAIPERE
jgi:superfamily I DNA/RNA helicase